jgi:hypothetical protein
MSNKYQIIDWNTGELFFEDSLFCKMYKRIDTNALPLKDKYAIIKNNNLLCTFSMATWMRLPSVKHFIRKQHKLSKKKFSVYTKTQYICT